MTGNLTVFIFVFALFSKVSSFRWENCGPSTNPIKLQDLTVTKTDETALYITMRAKVAVNLTEPIRAELKIQKRLPFVPIFVPIPCVDHMGSCDYQDLCEYSPYENATCPRIYVTNDLPCKCPIPMNSYAVKKFPVDLSFLPASALKGTYKINIKLFKFAQELFCIDIKIDL